MFARPVPIPSPPAASLLHHTTPLTPTPDIPAPHLSFLFYSLPTHHSPVTSPRIQVHLPPFTDSICLAQAAPYFQAHSAPTRAMLQSRLSPSPTLSADAHPYPQRIRNDWSSCIELGSEHLSFSAPSPRTPYSWFSSPSRRPYPIPIITCLPPTSCSLSRHTALPWFRFRSLKHTYILQTQSTNRHSEGDGHPSISPAQTEHSPESEIKLLANLPLLNSPHKVPTLWCTHIQKKIKTPPA